MTSNEFQNEARFQGLMHFVRGMLNDGLISDDEFFQICRDYAGRLSPKTGTLLTLLCVETRANIGEGKEADHSEDSKD